MHDIRFIRQFPEAFDDALKRRGDSPVAERILELDRRRRRRIARAEKLRAEQKAASRKIGRAKAEGDMAKFDVLRRKVSEARETMTVLDREASEADDALRQLLLTIPNRAFKDVPDGSSEDDNLVVRTWGEPREFSFEPREHFEIPGVASGMDFKTAARMSGSRFVLMSGAVARLHRALGQFMIDTQTRENGLLEMWTPVLVRGNAMRGTGQLPKFAEDSYRTEGGQWLIPTAEVTLTNIAGDTIVDEHCLPWRFCAHTQCFRSEAGAAGKDTAGMLRQHQFEKVEMVSVTAPEASIEELERMRGCAEGILEALGLPYRTVVLCTGDMGFGARKTYDLEVWLPGQGKHREISSVSNCGDFQARRMNARLRRRASRAVEFVHTLNGSGLAVGRTLIAVLENGQRQDGGVDIPKALEPYVDGATSISASGELA
ncbi:MAG: serine--tRNA ligase [Rhodobacteraceae bacterium]|nr:serine--tRNA ligase [Paracoccaceae bacterium]